eukprot:1141992-Pelagomonas_calceolata.AAC.3
MHDLVVNGVDNYPGAKYIRKTKEHRTIRLKGMQRNEREQLVLEAGAYNADFDGDEMNAHIPQSMQSQEELIQLANGPEQLRDHGSTLGTVLAATTSCSSNVTSSSAIPGHASTEISKHAIKPANPLSSHS